MNNRSFGQTCLAERFFYAPTVTSPRSLTHSAGDGNIRLRRSARQDILNGMVDTAAWPAEFAFVELAAIPRLAIDYSK
ncbi:hypothetical protein [Rosistilla oblonga]|uniref:hypothetical protein n=1 Tax=Rosistilla oblonga TaxID=2527990 RepID=UPI0011A1885D|nr:hypothetical protein [Rosistilla oblonga]